MQFTEIGVVVKPHGLKGAVVVKVDAQHIPSFSSFKTIYLEQFGTMVPYAVEEVAPLSPKTVKVALRGIDRVDGAEELRGRSVHQENSQLTFSDDVPLEGLKVRLVSGQHLGTVTETIDNKAQMLIVVETEDGDEHYIPLVEDYIAEIDVEGKTLTLDLPEGLLDL